MESGTLGLIVVVGARAGVIIPLGVVSASMESGDDRFVAGRGGRWKDDCRLLGSVHGGA